MEFCDNLVIGVKHVEKIIEKEKIKNEKIKNIKIF